MLLSIPYRILTDDISVIGNIPAWIFQFPIGFSPNYSANNIPKYTEDFQFPIGFSPWWHNQLMSYLPLFFQFPIGFSRRRFNVQAKVGSLTFNSLSDSHYNRC